jgi:purine-nucleoside phosphorylase
MDYNKTIEFIRSRTKFEPKTGIILGSGLGDVAKDILIQETIPYEEIPGFLKPTIEGHKGNLIFGYLCDKPIVAMQGRNHFYEGHSMQEITFPIRVMKLLGVETLITSNATGGMNEKFEIGDIMIVTDHINMMGTNPLIGPNDDRFGTRFPDMSKIYNREIIDYAKKEALNKDIKVYEGVLTALSGPAYETPAEYRWLRTIGADCVGMSTIPEITVGHHAGMKCFSMSLVTDLGIQGKIVEVTHEMVQTESAKAAPKMAYIVKKVVEKFG